MIPQIVNTILGGQDVMLLGERGQVRSRLARRLTALLDEETPVVKGAEIAENPFRPITAKGRTIVAEAGEETPVVWPLGNERYARSWRQCDAEPTLPTDEGTLRILYGSSKCLTK